MRNLAYPMIHPGLRLGWIGAYANSLGILYLNEANYDTLADAYWTSQGYDLSDPTDRATVDGLEEFKLYNLGYTALDGSDFEADLFAGNVLTYNSWKAAATS